MEKKELLLKLLDWLKWHWDMAEWFYILVEKWFVWEKELNWLMAFFAQAIKDTTDNNLRKKLQEWLSIIKKIQELEIKSKQEEQKELLELEKQIEELF